MTGNKLKLQNFIKVHDNIHAIVWMIWKTWDFVLQAVAFLMVQALDDNENLKHQTR